MFEPRSRAACPSRAGSPRPTSSGRSGSAQGAELAAGQARRHAAVDQGAGRRRPRHRRRRRAVAPAFRARLPRAGRRHRLRAQGGDGHPRRTATRRWCRRWSAPLRSRAACTRPRRSWRARHTTRKLKFTLPGPMTIVDTVADRHYGDRAKMAFAFAELLNQEALRAAGRRRRHRSSSTSRPSTSTWTSRRPGASTALERAAQGLTCTTAVHICYGYGIQANVDWKETLGDGMAPVRADVPGAREEHDRAGVARVHPLARAAAPDEAARGQGRDGRRDRRRQRRDRDAGAGGRHDRPGAAVRARRSGCSPAPTAAWRRCTARSRWPSWRRLARAPRWRGSATAVDSTASRHSTRVDQRNPDLEGIPLSRRTLTIDDRLHDYVLRNNREHPELAKLREATASHPHAAMQISPEQGALLQMLVKLLGARRTIEVGVFTGYSALAAALALPDDGGILACDISDEYTQVGRPYWERGRSRPARSSWCCSRRLRPLMRTSCRRRRRALRLRLHRCRQDGLRRLLRALPRAAAARRTDRDRQRAVERTRGRAGRREGCGYRGAAGAERQAAARRPRRPRPAADQRRADTGKEKVAVARVRDGRQSRPSHARPLRSAAD